MADTLIQNKNAASFELFCAKAMRVNTVTSVGKAGGDLLRCCADKEEGKWCLNTRERRGKKGE